MCKFTPLGFETMIVSVPVFRQMCVNLPRWGLKLEGTISFLSVFWKRVNLPRWGLKPGDIPESHVSDKV